VKEIEKPSLGSLSEDKKLDFGVVKNLISSIKDTRNRLIFQLFLNSGINPSELVELKYTDFDFEKSTLRIVKEISKNKKERIVSLPKELSEDIKEFANPRKLFVFNSKLSPQLTLRSLHRIIDLYSIDFGVKLTTHDLKGLYIQNSLGKKDVSEIKDEVGLNNFTKRITLSKEKINDIEEKIKDNRESLIFHLLLCGLKPSRIAHLKVRDIETLSIGSSLVKKLNDFVQERALHRHQLVFLTRQNTTLSNERILQIVSNLGNAVGVKLNSRILNNTGISLAIKSEDRETKLGSLGIKKERFHLHGGFVENG
jgi:integrase